MYKLIIISFLVILTAFCAFSAQVYEGVVVPLVKDQIPAGADADYWGYLSFTAKWGQIIRPEIKDLKGNVVKQGTVLTRMSRKYWVDNVSSAKGNLLAAEHDMDVAYENFIRYKQLYPTGASSVQLFQDMRADYYEAYGGYQTAKASLYESKRDLEECVHVAPFEGIVSKVFFSNGILATNPDVIEISQLNPIGIKVFMDIDKACTITPQTKVSIYLNEGEQSFGIYNGATMLDNDGIIFETRNYPAKNTDENLPKIQDCFPVVNFYTGKKKDNKLGVPVAAVNKDKNGFFVWRAKNRKILEPGQGVDPVFKLEKIYIVPGNLKRLYYGCDGIRILKNSGDLKLHDIVIISSSENLVNDMKVNYPPPRYVLMPGDKVKVVIDNSGLKSKNYVNK